MCNSNFQVLQKFFIINKNFGYMDFSRFFTTVITVLSFPIGYLIAKYSEDELKQSNKLLSILKLILYLSILIVILFIMWPLNYLHIILIIIGFAFSFIFKIEYIILLISFITLNLDNSFSILLVSLIFLYMLISGILSFKTLKTNKLKLKWILITVILLLIILILTLINNKDISIIYAFIFGYLLNLKNIIKT